MVAVTKEEYDASECFGKSSTITIGGSTTPKHTYYVCGTCHDKSGQSSTSTTNQDCEHKQKERCTRDPDGPSAFEIFTQFIADEDDRPSTATEATEINDRASHIGLFSSHLGRSWDCNDCKYWELPYNYEKPRWKTAYSTTHGAKSILDEVTTFCSYFIVRKCWLSQEERKECVQCMIDLVNFMLVKGYITDEKEAKRTLDWISPGLDFEPDTIQKKLNELLANNYWKNLLDEKNQDDGVTKKRQKIDDNQNDFPVGKVIQPELPWDVTKITEDGWVLGSYDSPTLEIILPPDVRELGLQHMSLSCMKLTYLGCGIWEPSGAYGQDEMVCANVYPP